MYETTVHHTSFGIISQQSVSGGDVCIARLDRAFLAWHHTYARDYNAEIQAKQQEADNYNSEALRLGEMADSLQAELDKINGQISAIQAQISDSQKKINNLNDQIKKNEELIKHNRKAMGRILADLYVDDQISPLEMLASSKNISDYIDKQEQRNSLKTSLNDKIKEIKSLQKKAGRE